MVSETINVEIVYALPDTQVILVEAVSTGATIKDVIVKSGVLETYDVLAIDDMKVGIFGKLAKMDQEVRDRDRIEIYRPLIADPKEVRKRKAAEGKLLKKGGASASETKK